MLSKTHSKNITLSIKSNKYQSIGVDLEFNKVRNPRLIKFIKNENDILCNSSILEQWVIKEAIFKAISNNGDNIKFLNESSVNFNNNTFYYKNIKGNYQVYKNNECILAIAFI
jgi:phosphopantetheinyl transferase (holo-ACP synthase)